MYIYICVCISVCVCICDVYVYFLCVYINTIYYKTYFIPCAVGNHVVLIVTLTIWKSRISEQLSCVIIMLIQYGTVKIKDWLSYSILKLNFSMVINHVFTSFTMVIPVIFVLS